MYQQFPIHVDLTDSNGRGILVATQTIIVHGANTSGTAATNRTYTAKCGYRLVEVGIKEYVGIVQSQQG